MYIARNGKEKKLTGGEWRTKVQRVFLLEEKRVRRRQLLIMVMKTERREKKREMGKATVTEQETNSCCASLNTRSLAAETSAFWRFYYVLVFVCLLVSLFIFSVYEWDYVILILKIGGVLGIQRDNRVRLGQVPGNYPNVFGVLFRFLLLLFLFIYFREILVAVTVCKSTRGGSKQYHKLQLSVA